MSQQIPPELAALLQGGGGGAPGGQPGGPPPQGSNGLDPLQEVIQLLPGVMSALPDPRDTQDVAKCLQILTGIQTRLMQGGQSGPGAQASGY